MIIHSKRFHEVFHAGSTPKLDISLLENFESKFHFRNSIQNSKLTQGMLILESEVKFCSEKSVKIRVMKIMNFINSDISCYDDSSQPQIKTMNQG